jgi:hypothetical protein
MIKTDGCYSGYAIGILELPLLQFVVVLPRRGELLQKWALRDANVSACRECLFVK